MAKPKPRGRKRLAAVFVLLVASLGAWYAQPWGRTLDEAALLQLIAAGQVTRVWVTDGGVEGGVVVAPAALVSAVPALADFQTPFFMPADEGEIPDVVATLAARGASVDVTWEIDRIREMAVAAQQRFRYYGIAGGDVQSYAQRLATLDPASEEAASLLRKVAERMAWDAEVALQDGPEGRAEELLEQCLALVPDHPRCLDLSEALTASADGS